MTSRTKIYYGYCFSTWTPCNRAGTICRCIGDLHRFFRLHAKGHVCAESAWVPSHWVRVFVPYSIFCCLLASITTQKIQQRYVLVFKVYQSTLSLPGPHSYIHKTKRLVGCWSITDMESASTLLGKSATKPRKWHVFPVFWHSVTSPVS